MANKNIDMYKGTEIVFADGKKRTIRPLTIRNLRKFMKIVKDLKTEDNLNDDDFGFSAVSEAEYNAVINNTTKTAEDYKARLQEVEKMIIPFLTKLHSTGDKEYIYWPNRKPVIEKQIENILKLTRD